MHLPGFTAESTLYQTRSYYRFGINQSTCEDAATIRAAADVGVYVRQEWTRCRHEEASPYICPQYGFKPHCYFSIIEKCYELCTYPDPDIPGSSQCSCKCEEVGRLVFGEPIMPPEPKAGKYPR